MNEWMLWAETGRKQRSFLLSCIYVMFRLLNACILARADVFAYTFDISVGVKRYGNSFADIM